MPTSTYMSTRGGSAQTCEPHDLLKQHNACLPDPHLVQLHACRKHVVKVLAQQLRPQLEATVKHNDDPAGQTYSPDAKSAARRALKNKALAYLAALGDAAVTQQVLNRYGTATNMTDKISALAALIDSEGEVW